jgi:hypothetical protein
MKTPAIPFFALLGCSLTACVEEKTDSTDTDTVDTDTVDTGAVEDSGDTGTDSDDISALVGLWTLDSSTSAGYYGDVTTTFPNETGTSYEGYGTSWSNLRTEVSFFDIAETGDGSLISSITETVTSIVNGVEIYSSTTGTSEVNTYLYATFGGDSDSYAMSFFGMELSCNLTSGILSCETDEFSLELSEGGEIPEDFEEYAEDYPDTPEYTKEACVDTTISTTGNSLEWGGFEDIDNDVALSCTYEVFSYDTFAWETVNSPDEDDLVFAFEAPNDGCFVFNSIGTDFTHGIQLQTTCDSETVLSCSTTNRLEHGMEAGETVLVVIDGEEGNDQVFNLSINERALDALPVDTSAMDTTAWTGEFIDDIACGNNSANKQFLWTAIATGTATFDLSGSDFNAVIQVEEATCGGGEPVCNGANPTLSFEVVQGSEYIIRLGGSTGFFGEEVPTGTLSMSISIAQ